MSRRQVLNRMRYLVDAIGLDDALEAFLEEARSGPARGHDESTVDYIHRRASIVLDEMRQLVGKNYKMTLIMRCTKKGLDANIVVTNDKLHLAAKALQKEIET